MVGSFGKTFHVTGWKVGYALAPRELTAEFRKVHQFVVFTVNTPVQLALADFMADPRRLARACRPSTSASATSSARALGHPRFEPLPCAGHLLPAGQLRAGSATSRTPCLAERLTRELGVASIPVSAFFADGRAGPGAALLLRQVGRDAGAGLRTAGPDPSSMTPTVNPATPRENP